MNDDPSHDDLINAIGVILSNDSLEQLTHAAFAAFLSLIDRDDQLDQLGIDHDHGAICLFVTGLELQALARELQDPPLGLEPLLQEIRGVLDARDASEPG